MFTLPFSELSLVELTFDLVSELSMVGLTLDLVSELSLGGIDP